jgi:adenylate kinase family enzyme
MKKVAIFGNAGGGKSTLARKLAALTGLPLYPLDTIRFCVGGGEVPEADYARAHAEILSRDEWILEGYGSPTTLWERIAAADTLIYIDLPLAHHYAWVIKRLVKGLFVNPEGWPAGSPIWRGSFSSLRVISLCHRHLTPRYRSHVKAVGRGQDGPRVHHLKSAAQMAALLRTVKLTNRPPCAL